jgi:hypothetical protein
MIKVFRYIDEIDAFIVNPDFKIITDNLGLTEWNEVVWIGRYFMLDNDYGEHWFDNWDKRDEREIKAKELNISYDSILAIDPDRFKNNEDGPCHSDSQRKNFWTDVLKSLQLSIDLIVDEAKFLNNERKKNGDKDYISDLDERIEKIKARR